MISELVLCSHWLRLVIHCWNIIAKTIRANDCGNYSQDVCSIKREIVEDRFYFIKKRHHFVMLQIKQLTPSLCAHTHSLWQMTPNQMYRVMVHVVRK